MCARACVVLECQNPQSTNKLKTFFKGSSGWSSHPSWSVAGFRLGFKVVLGFRLGSEVSRGWGIDDVSESPDKDRSKAMCMWETHTDVAAMQAAKCYCVNKHISDAAHSHVCHLSAAAVHLLHSVLFVFCSTFTSTVSVVSIQPQRQAETLNPIVLF